MNNKVIELAYKHYIRLNSCVDNKVYFNFLAPGILDTSNAKLLLSQFPKKEEEYIFGFQSPFEEGSLWITERGAIGKFKVALLTSESVYVRLSDGELVHEKLSTIDKDKLEALAITFGLAKSDST